SRRTRLPPLRMRSGRPTPPTATGAHLAGIDLQSPGSADTLATNAFSARLAPTPADDEAPRNAVIRAPEEPQTDEAATLAPRAHTASTARCAIPERSIELRVNADRGRLHGIGVIRIP
ncbi:MAG: hypothetical protein WBZ37_22950, partial [Mycobacterium sp.]